MAEYDVEHAVRKVLFRQISASRIVAEWRPLAGLSTTVFPAASAGPIFQIAIISG